MGSFPHVAPVSGYDESAQGGMGPLWSLVVGTSTGLMSRTDAAAVPVQ
jgi:hypothetical protein